MYRFRGEICRVSLRLVKHNLILSPPSLLLVQSIAVSRLDLQPRIVRVLPPAFDSTDLHDVFVYWPQCRRGLLSLKCFIMLAQGTNTMILRLVTPGCEAAAVGWIWSYQCTSLRRFCVRRNSSQEGRTHSCATPRPVTRA